MSKLTSRQQEIVTGLQGGRSLLSLGPDGPILLVSASGFTRRIFRSTFDSLVKQEVIKRKHPRDPATPTEWVLT